MSHWSASMLGQVMTQMSTVMVTEHLDRVALEVISVDVRVQLCEPCSIIHLINVSRQLMNIHTFHLTDCQESEKESEDKTRWARISWGVFYSYCTQMKDLAILSLQEQVLSILFAHNKLVLHFVKYAYDMRYVYEKKAEKEGFFDK